MSEVTPQDELRLARETLADAISMRGGVTDRSVANRLYYACFHAARAVLLSRGIDTKSHSGLIQQFGRVVVGSGDVSGADGSFLNDMYDYRQSADYKPDPFMANIDPLVSRTEEFVDTMETLIEETNGDDSDD